MRQAGYDDPAGEEQKVIDEVMQQAREACRERWQPLMQSEWLTVAVQGVARAIHEDHAFDRLPILADALQDVGCENADLLGHLREGGPHVNYCWVVELLLGVL